MASASTAVTGGSPPAELAPQDGYFVCDLIDVIPKDDMATMEHPVFSLSTKPDRRILDYSRGGVDITVTPSVKGLATIHDKDILIFCISQLMAAVNSGRPVGRSLTLTAHDLLLATNRETSGDGYQRLRDAFERLAGTRITTNMAVGDMDVTRGFGLIEDWQIVRRSRKGRMISVSVTLSDWLYQAVLSRSVLTLSRDYFRLRKPLERRLYELARKHCGRQPLWRVSLEVLQQKSGSASPRRVFRAMLREIISRDPLPDYSLTEEPGDMIRVSGRGQLLDETQLPGLGPLKEVTFEAGRDLVPGSDIYALEAEWRGWWAMSGRPYLRSPDRAFLGWLAKRPG